MDLLWALKGLRTPFFDVIFGYVTKLGEETVVMVILCMVFWCMQKRTAYIISVAFILSGLAVQGMKIGFRIERPWILDPMFSPVTSAMAQATGYSFPSGHTQAAVAVYGSIGATARKWPIKAACFLVAALVAFSRMYLGVHTLLDVAVSCLISVLFIWLTIVILPDEPAGKARELCYVLFVALGAGALIAIASALYSSGKIEFAYLSDCFKAAGAAAGFAAGMYIERIYIGFTTKAKSIASQIIKFSLGMAGLIVIKEGLKFIMGALLDSSVGLLMDMFRYFLMLLWVTAFFPYIIKRLKWIDL